MDMISPGGKFGDYTVVRLLGKGGMGSVYLLENAAGRQVAAKILAADASSDHEARMRFLREAELAMGVKHPNLIETYDIGEDPDTGLCYILMEYVPGGSLGNRLNRTGPLSVREALSIVYQIASVLELARQKGIVHRDIKPDNIMFGADGKAKLADLGIARRASGGETTTVTQTGTMIGTPAYMAPEQMLDSHAVDSRADIYSLGIVFYEMLTGVRPNKDDTVVQLMAKAMQGVPIPDVRDLRPEVSAAVAGLVSLMCAMDADGRPSTPAEVTLAISQLAHGREMTIRRKRPQLPPDGRSRKRSFLRGLLPFAIPVLAVAALGGWYVLGRPKKTEPTAPVVSDSAPVVPVAPPAPVAPVVPAAPVPVVTNAATGTPKPSTVSPPKVVVNGPPLVLPLGEGVEMRLIKCPEGTFTMGYPDSKWPAHKPREVKISRPFWIGRTLVTVAQWQCLMGPYELKDCDRVFGHLDLAVGRITDAEMAAFMAKLTERYGHLLPKGYVFRWPTDAEWEYACKAGGTDRHDPYVRGCWEEIERQRDLSVTRSDMVEFFKAKGFPDVDKQMLQYLWPVATKPPNRWGLLDMLGHSSEPQLDTFSGFDQRTGQPRKDGQPAKEGSRSEETVDPLSVSTEHQKVRLTRASEFSGPLLTGAYKRWKKIGLRLGVVSFRVVAGPDLLQERGFPPVMRSAPIPKQGKSLRFSLAKGVDLDFVNCPTGTFTMGWNCGKPNYAPHEVTFTRPFWGGVCPVTREQWNLFMKPKPMNEQERVLGAEKGAVPGATREEIESFCQKLTKRFGRQIPRGYVFRLPTLAEHEYMWRAGGADTLGVFGRPEGLSSGEREQIGVGSTGRRKILQAAGCDLSDADWKIPSRNPLMAVGRGLANPWGMYDFSGNGDTIVLDRFPRSRLNGMTGWAKSATDLTWQKREVDPLFWCEESHPGVMIVRGRLCRAWGMAYTPNSCDKLYLPESVRCCLFRLVVGPDLVRERTSRRQRGK